jgi:hypothetical protein
MHLLPLLALLACTGTKPTDTGAIDDTAATGDDGGSDDGSDDGTGDDGTGDDGTSDDTGGATDDTGGATDDTGPPADDTGHTGVDTDPDDTGFSLALDRFEGDIDLLDADVRLAGERVGDAFGYNVSFPGDLNADGYDEIFIGAAGSDAGDLEAGAAYLWWGPVTATRPADARFLGEHLTAHDKLPVTGGDIDGDGWGDLLVGAFHDDGAGERAGTVYLLRGASRDSWTTDFDLGGADALVQGNEPETYLGVSTVSLGDTNGDGYGDFILGTHNDEAYLVMGPVSGTVAVGDVARTFTTSGWYRVGIANAGPGDINGDGLDDVMVGAPGGATAGQESGSVYVLHGPVDGDLLVDLEADAEIVGEEARQEVGHVLSGAGDVNGDGYNDLLPATRYYAEGDGNQDYWPAAWVVLGDGAGLSGQISLLDAQAKFTGEMTQEMFFVSEAGDMDADGFGDLLFGSMRAAIAQDSAAWLVYGPVSGAMALSDADARFDTAQATDLAGSSLVGGGDVDGDGVPELLIGAIGAEAGQGAAYLVEAPTAQ